LGGEGECTPVIPLHSAVLIVIIPAKGAKDLNLPMPPKTHLALRRYTSRSLVQDSLAGRGWLFFCLVRAVLVLLFRFLAVSSRKSSASRLCSPPGEEAPDLRLSLEAEVRPGDRSPFAYGAATLYRRPFNAVRLDVGFITPCPRGSRNKWVPRPRSGNDCRLSRRFGLGFSLFARHY